MKLKKKGAKISQKFCYFSVLCTFAFDDESHDGWWLTIGCSLNAHVVFSFQKPDI